MNCHSTRAVLDLHAEGRLTPRRAKAVAAHLASCDVCRELGSPAAAPAPASAPAAGYKARLAAAMKAERGAPAAGRPAMRLELNLWPRDLSGVALAAAALALFAVVVGWSGAPSQQFDKGDELAAGRIQ